MTQPFVVRADSHQENLDLAQGLVLELEHRLLERRVRRATKDQRERRPTVGIVCYLQQLHDMLNQNDYLGVANA